jgi:hypothetical protein
MRVPPRGSGWVLGNCQLPIADCRLVKTNPQQLKSTGGVIKIDDRKSAIGNRLTHPLPRGGTDLMGPKLINVRTVKLH